MADAGQFAQDADILLRVGTGASATPNQVEEVHMKLREWLAETLDIKIAERLRIIYGGSVSSKNCTSLIEKKNIDGFIIGGASLSIDFVTVIQKII